ncbi:unnamed protein product, partial [Hapterophycus canaliculatus]
VFVSVWCLRFGCMRQRSSVLLGKGDVDTGWLHSTGGGMMLTAGAAGRDYSTDPCFASINDSISLVCECIEERRVSGLCKSARSHGQSHRFLLVGLHRKRSGKLPLRQPRKG